MGLLVVRYVAAAMSPSVDSAGEGRGPRVRQGGETRRDSCGGRKERADALFRSGKYAEAVEAYTHALGADPNSAVLYSNRSAAFIALEKWPEALKDARKGAGLDEGYPKAHYRQGIALHHLGEYEDAVTAFSRALKLEPNNRSIRQKLELASTATQPSRIKKYVEEIGRQLTCGNIANASALLEETRSLSSHETSPHLAFYQGCIYHQHNQLERSLRCYNKALKLLPTLISARKNAVVALTALGRHEEALENAEIAVKFQPDSAERYFELGVILMTMEKYRESSEAYTNALSINPVFKEAYINNDNVLLRLNAIEDCRKNADKAIASRMDNFWVNRMQRPPHFTPHLRSKPWWEPSTFSWVAKLENEYEDIRSEVCALLGFGEDDDTCWGQVGKRSVHDGSLVSKGTWREFPLLSCTPIPEEVVRRCPKTLKVLESIPEIAVMASTGVGESLFSLLHPGTHLRPHCGSTNARLTAHLGIKVPSGCFVTAGGEKRQWEEGKCIVFDDSYEHSVEHNGDTIRVVLLINFWHPDMDRRHWKPLGVDSKYNTI